ncbi:MAG TPA: sodium:proton antiporter NhaD, partial [Halomonas sp.]|nr:sodium:proton antiporter NhaD [Halomonas sp.]
MKPPNVLATRLHASRVAWLLITCCLFIFPSLSYAAAGPLDLTLSIAGISSVVIFVLAYALVMTEELLHMRKSKPVLVAAGLIWAIVAWVYVQAGMPEESEAAFRETLLEYAELLLFLLVAMTYINAMEER